MISQSWKMIMMMILLPSTRKMSKMSSAWMIQSWQFELIANVRKLQTQFANLNFPIRVEYAGAANFQEVICYKLKYFPMIQF